MKGLSRASGTKPIVETSIPAPREDFPNLIEDSPNLFFMVCVGKLGLDMSI